MMKPRRHPAEAPTYAMLLDPGTAMLALTAASAGASAFGSIQEGQAKSQAYSFNASQLEARAQSDRDQAAAEAALDQQRTRIGMGNAFAAAGASGVDPTQGSPLSVMSDLASRGELTRRLTLYRGDVAATGDLNQAAIDRFSGRQAAAGGLTKGIGALLGAATKYYGDNRSSGGGSDTIGPSYSGATGPYGYNTPGGLRVGGTDYNF